MREILIQFIKDEEILLETMDTDSGRDAGDSVDCHSYALRGEVCR